MISIGKREVLHDCRNDDGSPCISITNTHTVYRRAGGTFFIPVEGMRCDLQPVQGQRWAFVLLWGRDQRAALERFKDRRAMRRERAGA